MKRKVHDHPRMGFTLIELVVVVLVIAILGTVTGMTGKYVLQRMNYKKANTDLTNIQHAIEAFYVAYGHYPPVSHFGHQPKDLRSADLKDKSDGKDYYVPVNERNMAGAGLEGYIFSTKKTKKAGGASASMGEFDLPKKAVKWAHFLEDIQVGDYSASPAKTNTPDKGETTYERWGFVIVDPWMSLTVLSPGGAELRYQYASYPDDNYQTYELWCKGADLTNTNDDFYIHRRGDSTQQAHTYEVR